MDADKHFFIAVPLGGIVWWMTGNIPAGVTAFAAHFLIDIDHFFDYFFNHGFGKLDLRLSHFFKVCNCTEFTKLFLFLHSYELAVILSIMYFYYKNLYLGAFLIGFLLHLILDTAFNRVSKCGYFFVYRWKMRFNANKIFSGLI